MDETTQLLRIDIDGPWTAAEMARSLQQLDELYRLKLVLEAIATDTHWVRRYGKRYLDYPGPYPAYPNWRALHYMLFPEMLPPGGPDPVDPSALIRLAAVIRPGHSLLVRRVQYASPGFKDLAGIGEIVGHVKDFLLRCIEMARDRKKNKLTEEGMQLDNDRKRIENAQQFLGVSRRFDVRPEDMRTMMGWVDQRQGQFLELAAKDKVKDVRLVPDDEPPPPQMRQQS